MTESQKQTIIELRNQGVSYRAIGKQIGLNHGTVCQFCQKVGLDGVRAETRTVEDPDEYIRRYTDKLKYVSGWKTCEDNAVVQCLDCGNVFEYSMKGLRSHKSAVPCSACRAEAQRQRAEQRAEQKRLEKAEAERLRVLKKEYKQTQWKVCPVCNNLFCGSTRTVYCSEACRHKNKWHMKDGYRYLFPLDEVFKKDKGICHLCGKPCDWNDYKIKNGVIVYGNNYPSRDHIVPKSKGGDNSWSNIKLAHRICNSLKGVALMSL